MESIVFDDFSGGWRGTLDLAKCPKSMFDGRNVLIYRDGSLGPRPGLKTFSVGSLPFGRVRGALHTGHPVRPFVWVQDTTLYATSDDGLGNFTTIGTLAGPPSLDLPLKMTKFTGRQSFMSVPGTGVADRIYWIWYDGNNTLLQNLNGYSGFCNSPYGVRLVAGRGDTALISYSAPMDGSVWPAANTIRLAFDGIPVHLSEQRNHLVIVLDDGSWFVLTGVPGVNDTLRRVAGSQVYPAPLGYDAFIDTGDDIINFLSPSGNFPGSFDGANLSELPYLSMTPENPRQSYADGGFVEAARAVTAIQGSGTASPGFILRDPVNRLLLKHNGAWGLHEFGVPVGQAWAFNGQGRLIGSEPDKASGSAVWYSTELRLDRPAFTSDALAQPGDNSTLPLDAWFSLPEQWTEDGNPVRVSEVVVDFMRWNTGAAVSNRIQVTVDAYGRGRTGSSNGTQTETWEQPGSDSGAGLIGTADQLRFSFGAQGPGSGHGIKLHGLRGVAIRRVVMNYEPASGDGRNYA